MSVIVNAPSVFRFTAEARPERHLGVGYGERDIGKDDLGRLFKGAMRYW